MVELKDSTDIITLIIDVNKGFISTATPLLSVKCYRQIAYNIHVSFIRELYFDEGKHEM